MADSRSLARNRGTDVIRDWPVERRTVSTFERLGLSAADRLRTQP